LAQGAKKSPPLSHSKQGIFDNAIGPKLAPAPFLIGYRFIRLSGVAARIGAGVVARLANSPDIACIERLAITNSGPQRTCVSLC
jgi:hypothetical protein